MNENWYLVLELEFDPNPVCDESKIEQRIEEKRKFWSREANNFNHGAEYKKYSQMIPQIKKDMIGESNIRAKLIKDACESVYTPIDRVLKMLKKTEVSNECIEKIAKKNKVDFESVKRRAFLLGMKISTSKNENYNEIFDKYYKRKPQNADKFDGMNAYLKSFNVPNLYKFLYLDASITNPEDLPCETLRERARERRVKEFYKNDSISSSGSKLCNHCMECFKNDVSKQIYDRYLEYKERREVIDQFQDIYEYDNELTQEVYLGFISRLTKILKSRKEAELLLIAFCKNKKIPAPVLGDEKKVNSHIKICRCGCSNDISDGRKKCHACGKELQVKCPNCGKVSDIIINVCKCGFKFKNMDKATALCELASNALDAMDFTAAEMHLSNASVNWPGSEKVSQLNLRLNTLKKRVEPVVKRMKMACMEKKYYEARKQLNSIKNYSPNYTDSLLEEEINNAIDAAEKYKHILETEKDEDKIIKACTKAYEASKDCPGIKQIINQYPPKKPSGLVVISDTASKVNALSWKKSPAKGMVDYLVIRKEGDIPRGIHDGTMVGRASRCNINDHNVKPGVQYFYSVFAERAEVYSKGLSCEDPVVNLFEISNLRMVPGDNALELTWDPIADNASVNIERTDESGKCIKLSSNNRKKFVDMDIENDKKYVYRVFLSYSIGINNIDTKGVKISGIPTKLPLPVEKILIKPTQRNEFYVKWESLENREVKFFYSSKKPNFIKGDIVPISAIERSMTALVIKKKSNKDGTFKYDGEGFIYIIPVVTKANSAVIGKIYRVSKNRTAKIKNASLVNGKIMIFLEPPKYATGFVVLSRHDKFPLDISDMKTTRKYISLKQYQYDGGLVIDSNEQKDYYFSVFVEFRRDGEIDYSIGTNYLYSNAVAKTIFYSISVKKNIFGNGSINITFEGENEKFKLPDIDVISAQDRAPVFKKSGKIFHQISGREVVKSTMISIPFDKKIKRETYIKPFLKYENLASKYILKIKLGSNHKIR